jgi:hypothetical protein
VISTNFSEATLRRNTTAQSFERGEHYYTSGAVRAAVRRGMTLEARVEGSQSQFWYYFPDEYGGFEPDEFNCAVFPGQVGIPIPVEDGIVRLYTEAMRKQGASKWEPMKSS